MHIPVQMIAIGLLFGGLLLHCKIDIIAGLDLNAWRVTLRYLQFDICETSSKTLHVLYSCTRMSLGGN